VRRGERPRASEFLARHPQHAEALAGLLSTIAGLEELRNETTPTRPLERLGNYRIVRELGRGGMGVVYEAEEEQLARRVAVKVLSGEIRDDERSLARFQREARLAARLVHPNVVPIHAFGDECGTRFFAMHLVDGIGLDRVIDAAAIGLVPQGTGDPLVGLVREQLAGQRGARGDRTLHRTPAWRNGACLAIAQAADALAFAHAQGVLHRDIKPPNLILDRSGHLWVADFGLAKGREDEPITVTGNIAGTLRYLAPELFDGKQDGRSDVYSLGLTLFELLTLQPAFNAGSRATMMKEVIAGRVDLRALRVADPGIPAALEHVVATACARRPADRYRDAAEFARDLRAVAAGRPVVVATAPPAPVRRPNALPVLMVAACVVAIGAWLLLRGEDSQARKPLPAVPAAMAPHSPDPVTVEAPQPVDPVADVQVDEVWPVPDGPLLAPAPEVPSKPASTVAVDPPMSPIEAKPTVVPAHPGPLVEEPLRRPPPADPWQQDPPPRFQPPRDQRPPPGPSGSFGPPGPSGPRRPRPGPDRPPR
jgi:serine/threonine protein kinase